ncbi:MAG: GNAT family N-acetyltransferase [Lachnospiraceae bacterium]|nr:GNAT family N-acetyltransferase [Lachnospiraceae bacterium]
MLLFNIDKDLKLYFENLAPLSIWNSYLQDNMLVIGAVADEDEGARSPIAAGVFAFYMEGRYLTPVWCYVDPKFRRKGIATEVFERVRHILRREDRASIQIIEINRKVYKEWYGFIASLNDLKVEDTEQRCVVFSTNDLRKNKHFPIKGVSVTGIDDIGEDLIKDFSEELDEREKKIFFEILNDELMRDLSCFKLENGHIVAAVLFKKAGDAVSVWYFNLNDDSKDELRMIILTTFNGICSLPGGNYVMLINNDSRINDYVMMILGVKGIKQKIRRYTL